MCRLFGIMANNPVNIHFSFTQAPNSMVCQSTWNPDGWGIGWYDNYSQRAHVFKEPISAEQSKRLDQLTKNIKSKLMIAHIRKSTTGKIKLENTHPFCYKNWIFAHNGSILTYSMLRKKLLFPWFFEIQGETDSEVYFYWLLQCIQNENNLIAGIKSAILEIIESHLYSGLNFLLSDGMSLYSFRYGSDYQDYYSLFYLKRDTKSPADLYFLSKETRQLIEHKCAKGEKAVLIASEKLTLDEDWQEIPWGSLAVVQRDLSVKLISIL